MDEAIVTGLGAPATGCSESPLNSMRRAWARLRAPVPGLLLTAGLAWLSFAVRQQIGLAALSPLIVAIILGMTFHNLIGTPARAQAGVKLSLRRVLRIAIVLLGLQLTFAQVSDVGGAGLMVIAIALVTTFLVTKFCGRLLGVDRGLAELIAAGTSICGASAVIATNTVTRARDEDVAYAVACVTVFGSLSMMTYPLLEGVLQLPPRAYGLWSGASIHEVAQVVAAAFQGGREAGEFGTVAKLTRVMMLAPLVIALGVAATGRSRRRGEGQARTPMPWFVLGFVGMIGIDSLGIIPPAVKATLIQATTFLLAMALAAMGLETDVGKLKAKGVRPLMLGAFSSIFISALSLALVLLL